MLKLLEKFIFIGFTLKESTYYYHDYSLVVDNDMLILRKNLSSYKNARITIFYPVDYEDKNVERSILLIKNYFPCLERKEKIKSLLEQNDKRNI